MLQSFEDFRAAVSSALKDKVAQRIEAEKEHISNELFRGVATETTEESQSNETEN